MKRHGIERLLWLTALSCGVVAGWLLQHAPRADVRRLDIGRALPLLSVVPRESVSAWSRTTASTNPFRFTRLPSALRFGEAAPAAAAVEARPRPALKLLGTIGGPPWQGVVGGLPGRSGSVVVRPGQQLDSFVVRSVARDKVVIVGSDTIWVLTVRQPWK